MKANATIIDPICLHLGGTPAGDDLLDLAERLRFPLTLDLLRLSPPAARMEAAMRIARHLTD